MRKSSMANPRIKGKSGEREWANYLKALGFNARRGQQYAGSPDSPDVICSDLPFHWEVKRVEKIHIHKAMKQATDDASTEQIPVVVHRRSKDKWLITLTANDFFVLIKTFLETIDRKELKLEEKGL